MRVLDILASADPATGGPLEGVFRRSEIWQAAGHVCELATLDPPGAPYLAGAPLPIHALGQPRPTGWRRFLPWRHYGYSPAFVPWLRDNIARYDAVIVNGLWNYSVMGARRVLVGGNTPYVVFVHGMLDPWFRQSSPTKNLVKQGFWLFNEGPLINGARAALFTTDEEREVSRDAFRPYRVRPRVVGYGTSDVQGDPATQIAAFRAAVPTLQGRRYLLFLSRIHPKKGCDLLIAAFAAVAAAHPDLDLVMAGPDQVGWSRDLKAQANAAGIADRIHWPGMLTGDTKFGAFRGCEAFVLSSHQENFGVVVAEAMACERPVLISDKVQVWREVVAGNAGMVQPDTTEGTRLLLERFLALPRVQTDVMGRAGRTVFLERFTIEAASRMLLQAIQEEIAAHGHS